MLVPDFNGGDLEIHIDACLERASISYRRSSPLSIRPPGPPSICVRLSKRMDCSPDGHFRHSDPARLWPRRSVSAAQSHARKTAPFTSPLPQTHWENVPLPYRPREWSEVSDIVTPTIESFSSPFHASSDTWHSRRFHNRNDLRQNQHNLSGHPTITNVSPLHSEMNPYSTTFDDYEDSTVVMSPRRPNSQPNTPSFGTAQLEPYAPSPISPVHAPRFSPTISRSSAQQPQRQEQAQRSTDETFTDEEEVHLFVQATVGLGPEEDGLTTTYLEPPLPAQSRQRTYRPLQRSQSERIISPIESTPTTRNALHALAQMPQNTYVGAQPHGHHMSVGHGAYGSHAISQEHPYLPYTGFGASGPPGMWPSAPGGMRFNDIEDDIPPPDDELPDYAESQAQVQAAQIAAATRRAQELQRRWQLSR